jgi:hypothetical protein
MILHRYFSSHAFETLKEAKLKTARISDFNDPFEFLYVPVGKLSENEMKNFIGARDSNILLQVCNQLLEKQKPGLGLTEQDFETFLKQPKTIEDITGQWPAIVANNDLSFERRRQIIDEGLRAICFADSTNVKPLDEILLWSHYANKHKGVRIGFDFPNLRNEAFKIEQMRYEEKRPEVVFSLGADANQEAYNALLASAKVKSTAWKYENEHRLFTQTRACERRQITNGDGTQFEEYFLEIDRGWFRSVDFGALCPEAEIKKITSMLKSDYPGSIICQRAKFHRTDYALEFVPVTSQH